METALTFPNGKISLSKYKINERIWKKLQYWTKNPFSIVHTASLVGCRSCCLPHPLNYPLYRKQWIYWQSSFMCKYWMIITMWHWLKKELIKGILQMLLLLISWLQFNCPWLGRCLIEVLPNPVVCSVLAM